MFVRMSLKQVDDDLIEWLSKIGYWNKRVASRIREAGNLLPMDVELEIRAFLKGKINKLCLMVLNYMKSDSCGIEVEKFDLSCLDVKEAHDLVEIEQQIEDALIEGKCACDVLIEMGLLRIDEITRPDEVRKVFKPLKAAFDPRIVDLIGLNAVY